ncbi:MAG: DUF4433 domain-containing protein [Flavobacterium sp.]|nr:MAG: DUF4433 domain-containing protein [Flavobacterium sp.]
MKKIYLYRMTHIENIPHILKHGITHQNSVNSNNSYIPIGLPGLILKREAYTLYNGKSLGTYIPFYFGARMPMLYVILLGSNSVKYDLKTISSTDIVYCISSVEQIINHNLGFVFSDGHAVSDLTNFYNEEAADKIANIVDYNAVNSKYWTVEHDLDLKRRKEAEFLVEEDIPVSAILGFAVHDVEARKKLLQYGISDNIITVKPNFYFK